MARNIHTHLLNDFFRDARAMRRFCRDVWVSEHRRILCFIFFQRQYRTRGFLVFIISLVSEIFKLYVW